jgi:hypothetical protein
VGGELGGVMFCSDTDHGALPLADHLVIRIGEEEVASWVKRRGRQRGGGGERAWCWIDPNAPNLTGSSPIPV